LNPDEARVDTVNLLWGLKIAALGMGLVFGLLALLWGLLTVVQRLDRPAAGSTNANHDASAVETPQAVAVQARSGDAGTALDPALAAAITMAVLSHRAVRRRAAAPSMRSYWPGSLLYASRWVGAGRARQTQYWCRRGR
jgi:glutaconyl-CoA/methylmalonyl-CoA decarboxylase subunit delta